MPGRKRGAWVLLVACLGLIFFQAGQARASTFEVTPVRLPLTATSTSKLLTVRNQSSEVLRFQVTAFAWNQSPEGELKLAPTQDLVVFPSLLSIKPGETRNLRVGALTSFGPSEKSYRVFVEELPQLVQQQNSPNAIRVLTKMGIPVFLEPASPSAAPRIDALTLKQTTLSFSLANAGISHFLAQKVRITASESNGTALFQQDLPAWYVLAGGSRLYRTDLPAAVCAATRIMVSAETDKGSIEASIAPPADCRSR